MGKHEAHKQFIDVAGFWSEDCGPFLERQPRARALAQHIECCGSWLSVRLFDNLIIPAVLAGSSLGEMLSKLVAAWLFKWDCDGGASLDDASMDIVPICLRKLRCLRAVTCNQLKIKIEYLSDVLDTWKELGSRKRTAQSLLANALDTSPYWRPHVEALVSNPAMWLEQAPAIDEVELEIAGLHAKQHGLADRCINLFDKLSGFVQSFGVDVMSAILDAGFEKLGKGVACW